MSQSREPQRSGDAVAAAGPPRNGVPVPLKIAGLTLAATAFYTYVGQLVPQKEVQPPEVTTLAATMTTEDLVKVGEKVVADKGSCLTCHTIGKASGPMRFPDLAGIGSRAATRIPGLSELEYLAQSLYHPNDYIVPGFNPGMPVVNKPPIGLTDEEIRAVIAYLQSLGGTPSVTMQTAIPYAAGGAAPAASDAAAGAQAQQAAAAAGASPASAAAAAPAAASGPRTVEVLRQQYQCAGCHSGAAGKPASLDGVGARLDERRLVAALAAHPPFTEGGGIESASLAEVRALARFLAAQKAESPAASGANRSGP